MGTCRADAQVDTHPKFCLSFLAAIGEIFGAPWPCEVIAAYLTSVVVESKKSLPELAVPLVDGGGKAGVVAGYMAAPCVEREEKH